MGQLIIYPRFYTSHAPSGRGSIKSDGDLTVEELYKLNVNRAINTRSWSYRKQVLDSALRLFGNFGEWLGDQKNNPHLVGYNSEFLKDTLRFIRTGERELSVQNWLDLVTETSQVKIIASGNTGVTLNLNSLSGTEAVLQAWCSHCGGFEDLLNSLHLLFGASRKGGL